MIAFVFRKNDSIFFSCYRSWMFDRVIDNTERHLFFDFDIDTESLLSILDAESDGYENCWKFLVGLADG